VFANDDPLNAEDPTGELPAWKILACLLISCTLNGDAQAPPLWNVPNPAIQVTEKDIRPVIDEAEGEVREIVEEGPSEAANASKLVLKAGSTVLNGLGDGLKDLGKALPKIKIPPLPPGPLRFLFDF
jgi:hypothetical protein